MATRVFLLSSDEKAVHAITQILDELEISFEHSSDAPFTLKRLGTQRFDLLIVDCDNPQTATQVFNSARASALNKAAIAIAIVEGKAGVPNAFRLGASLVLTKPVSLEQVRNTLRTGVGMTKKDGPESKPAAPHVSAPAPAPAPVPTSVPTLASIPSPVVHSAPSVAPSAPSTAPSHPVAPVISPVAAVPPIAQMPVPPVVPPPSVVAPATARALESPPAPPAPSIPVSIAPVVVPVAVSSTAPKSDATAQKPASLSLSTTSSSPTAPSEAKLSIDAILEALPKPPAAPAAHPTASFSAAAAAPALSKTESLSSILASLPATDTSKDGPASPFKEKEALPFDLPDPSEDSLGEDSAASLRASAVPAFGGLNKQPFAGIEPPKRSRAGLIVMGVLVLLAGSATAAWFLKPPFRSAVLQKYSFLKEQVALWRGHSVPVATPPAPVPSVPAQPLLKPAEAPATEPAMVGNNSAPAAGIPATGSAASVAPSATPAGAPTSSSTNPAPAPTPASPSGEKSGKATAPASKEPPTHPASNPASANGSAAGAPAASAAPGHASGIFEVPEDYADDQVIHRVRPAYPKQARGRKLQGTVVLQAIIDKKGKVNSLQLVSGDPVLAQAAADAVKQWRYKPYSHNGDPAEFQTRVTVEFHPTAAER